MRSSKYNDKLEQWAKHRAFKIEVWDRSSVAKNEKFLSMFICLCCKDKCWKQTLEQLQAAEDTLKTHTMNTRRELRWSGNEMFNCLRCID